MLRTAFVDIKSLSCVNFAHLIYKLRERIHRDPLYFVSEPIDRPLFKKANVEFIPELTPEVVRKAKGEVWVVSNDGRLLWQLSEENPVYVKVICNGLQEHRVFESLEKHGHKVVSIEVLNRYEGYLAKVLGFDYDEALRLIKLQARYQRTQDKLRELDLSEEISIEDLEKLCEEKHILYVREALFLMAWKKEIKIKDGKVLMV